MVGCCNVCCSEKLCGTWKPGKLSRFLGETWAPFICSVPGMAITAVVFLTVTVMGFVGLVLIQKDFKLEWFLPAVNTRS